MVFEDRILVNPRLLRLKNPQTNEVIDWEIQDLEPEEVVQEGTEINAQVMNEIQTTVVDGLNSTSTTDALSANQGRILNQSRIVDIVSNSDGTAYKYENGLMMCSMRYIVNSTVDGQWGYSYISSPKIAKNYPVAFISNPVYQINIEPTGRDGAWIMNDGVASGTKPSNFYLVRGDNLTNAQDFIINVFAIGNWK